MYRYRIKSMGRSSSFFGNCDVCGCHVSEVYYQVEEMRINADQQDMFTHGTNDLWTTNGCESLYGHKTCLEKRRI